MAGKKQNSAQVIDNQAILAQIASLSEQMQRLAAIVANSNPEAVVTEQPQDIDFTELKAKRDKENAAIMATIPSANRKVVEAALKRVQNAGYPYARLATNSKHQLDGLHIYAGQKGHGRDAAFIDCQTKRAKEWAKRRDDARAKGEAKPKPLARVFVWSPVGGGNLYARGIFGDIEA